MRQVILFVMLMAGTVAQAQEADENAPPPAPEPIEVIAGPFKLDAYGEVPEEDRTKVRDLLRSLKLILPDAELSALEGQTVVPPAPEVTSTPDLFATRMTDLMQTELSKAASAGAEEWPGVGPSCSLACDTVGGLAEGFCVAWFKGQTAALCLAASSAASGTCTGGCPQ
jgi:hypothetical protein